jgi:hypothetical protein
MTPVDSFKKPPIEELVAFGRQFGTVVAKEDVVHNC